MKKAAENIKNNENLKQSLQAARDKSYQGFNSASTYAGKMSENAQSAYQQNYHGKLYSNVTSAVGELAQKA